MNNQEKKLLMTTVAITGVVILSIRNSLKTIREEEAKRAEIDENLIKSINAIQRAESIVIERIQNGEYNDKGWPAVMNDMKFETIIARIEED